MAVTVQSSGPRGSKTYEIRVDGQMYDYTDNAAAARKIAAKARKEVKAGMTGRSAGGFLKRNPGGKAVRLRNFTGVIKRNPNGTVSIKGKGKR